MTGTVTHETYVHAVAQIAIARLNAADRAKADAVKLVYGAGQSGLRGVTYFSRWKNGHKGADGQPIAYPFVEVCAFGQESHVQLAGTTLHELGHVLAGWEAGHKRPWHEACARLGLRCIRAAGTNYCWANFEPDIREAIARLPKPDEGAPTPQLVGAGGIPFAVNPKPCGAGRGTMGGRSSGKGSGSRLRLFECCCEPPTKVRLARDVFHAQCLDCDTPFIRR